MRDISAQIVFEGPFAALARDFILYKQAMGFLYREETCMLRRFCRAFFHLPQAVLDKETVLAWCEKIPGESIYTQRQRQRVLRQFAMYLDMMGYEAYIHPKQSGKVTAPVYTPYIFSEEQIRALFAAMDKRACLTHGLGPFVYPLMMRMLYACGLRVSEATALRVRDVDTEKGLLTLRCTKFGKERLVPMSRSLSARCASYAQAHLRLADSDSPFFPAPDGRETNPRMVYHHFRKMLAACGIPHMGKGKGPRLHDLRHTFSVHCLNRAVAQGEELYAVLPLLAAYLGHTSILMTQRYLRLTAQVYPFLLSMTEAFCKGVIPAPGGYA